MWNMNPGHGTTDMMTMVIIKNYVARIFRYGPSYSDVGFKGWRRAPFLRLSSNDAQ